MLIQTSRFGEIEVEENQIISFPSGLVGFSEDRRFVIREDDAAAPFLWLQSVEDNGLAFVMIEPHVSVSNCKRISAFYSRTQTRVRKTLKIINFNAY